MDYVLYCVKYMNPWHGSYLRRGVDQINVDGVTSTNIRHEQYVEKDEILGKVVLRYYKGFKWIS